MNANTSRIVAMHEFFADLSPREKDTANGFMLGYACNYVPDEQWQEFLEASRKAALATRPAPKPAAAVPLPPASGTVTRTPPATSIASRRHHDAPPASGKDAAAGERGE